jgi:ketosteroid isomerase-like protein
MKKLLVLVLSSFIIISCSNEKKSEEKTEAAPAETKAPPAEFADAKYSDIGKNAIAALSSGDVAGYLSNYSENAVYLWNNGDSLAGKTAISDFWTKRRKDVIDSLTFSNGIWLPVKVNEPQSIEAPGVWLLAWYQVHAKYKTGKSMTQWMHMDFHFNAEDKIDRTIQYVDMVPINKAVAK